LTNLEYLLILRGTNIIKVRPDNIYNAFTQFFVLKNITITLPF